MLRFAYQFNYTFQGIDLRAIRQVNDIDPGVRPGIGKFLFIRQAVALVIDAIRSLEGIYQVSGADAASAKELFMRNPSLAIHPAFGQQVHFIGAPDNTINAVSNVCRHTLENQEQSRRIPCLD